MLRTLLRTALAVPCLLVQIIAGFELVMLVVLDLGTGHISAILFGIVFMLPASVAIHEVGHLLVAWREGFSVQLFAVWPAEVIRTAGGIRLQLNWTWSHRLGGVGALPMDLHRVRVRMILFSAGGPLATLILMLACAVLALATAESPPVLALGRSAETWNAPEPDAFRAIVFSGFTLAILVNVVLLASSLNPVSKKITSDGAHLIDWLIGGPEAAQSIALIGIGAATRTGVRARNWDTTLIERALGAADGSPMAVCVRLVAYYQAVDCGDLQRAREHLDCVLKHRAAYPGRVAAITLEGAYFEGFFRRDAIKAREWFSVPGASEVEEQTRLRAEAAVLLAEGHLAAAAAKAEAGLAVVMKSEDPGGAISERDWLTAIVAECRKSLPTSSS